MTYEIKKIRTFQGNEGMGLNATIYLDGKPIAFVLDDAWGGDVQFDFRNPGQSARSVVSSEAAKAAEAAFGAFCTKWFDESGERAKWIKDMREHDANYDGSDVRAQHMMESWVNHTVDMTQNKKRFDRIAKKKTLFRLSSDPAGDWRTLTIPYGPKAQAFLDQKYHGQVAEIYGVKEHTVENAPAATTPAAGAPK